MALDTGGASLIAFALRYETSGKIFDEMKNGWLDKKYPGHAAVVLHIVEVYSGSEKLA